MTGTQREAPRIETSRLLLVGHRTEDFAECCAMWADPVVTRFISGKASTPAEVWLRLLRYIGHWSALGYGTWVVREKAGGRFVGEVGLANNKRDLDASLGELPELGYALASWCHGQGFATEAIHAVLEWADASLASKRTWCLIGPEAKASMRVAEKCGYRELKRSTMNEKPVVLLDRG